MSWMESQIETRSKLDNELIERAYAELASSVSRSRENLDFSANDVEQADSAVKICLKHFGIEPGSVPEGIDDVNERMDWLCRPTGTMRREVQLAEGWYKQAIGAMVSRLDTGDVVALLPHGLHGYCYVDPVSGRKVKITARNKAQIQPSALLFYRPLPAKPLKIRDLLAFIAHVFSRSDYALVFVAALAVALIGLVPAQANKVAFGTVVPSGQADLIAPLGVLLLGVAVSSALIQACRNLVMARVSIKLDIATESATFARLLSLPTSFFKKYSAGDLASRVANVTMLSQQIASIVLGSSLSALLSLVYVAQIGVYAPVLAAPALGIVVIEALLTILVTRITMRFELETIESSVKLSGTVTALLNGIQKIKLAGAEDRAFAKWAHGYATYARAAYNRPGILRALPALVVLVGLVGNVALYYLAGSAHVAVDDYMAFNVAYGQVTAAILALASVAGEFAQIRPMLKMVEPILEATPETGEDKPNVSTLSGGVEVAGVAFRYNDESPYVVENLSFKVNPGEYVALVGKSGCGKSTILRLMLGFEKPERGTILYGPYDVQKVDLRSLRQHIGVVMQDGKLFMGDIASNITISTPSATLDDAWEAAELAGVAEDIRKMPMGMQTIVTEGSGGVSGGQRQRLMIARAVCGKRRILMLDEATSALDNITQKHVSDSLDELKCTRIVVAHRLSTVRHCDRILVVDRGTIVEEGSYEELIEKDGIFAELVRRQRLEESSEKEKKSTD